jgi:hypothetical protein
VSSQLLTPASDPVEDTESPMAAGSPQRGPAQRYAAVDLPVSAYDEWDRFVSTSVNGSIFQTAWWQRAWGLEPLVRVIRDSEGELQAGLCCTIARRFGTSAIIKPPMTCFNGPVHGPIKKHSRHGHSTQLKHNLLAILQGLPRLGMYDLVLTYLDSDVVPFLWNGFDAMVEYSYVIPVKEKETWIHQTSKTRRWTLRKAYKDAIDQNFHIDSRPELSEVLSVLEETAAVKHYSFARFLPRWPAWWDAVMSRKAGRAYILRDSHGRGVSTSLMVHDQRSAFYIAGGMRRDVRKGFLMNVLLTHRMIEDAHQMGLDFDFAGTLLPGVEGFFRSFGAELRLSHRLVKFPSPMAFLIWQGYRYFSRHRMPWVWYD